MTTSIAYSKIRFSDTLKNLSPGTKYYVRSVAVEKAETGEEIRRYSPIQATTTTR